MPRALRYVAALAQHIQQSPAGQMVLEGDHRVISVSDQLASPLESRSRHLLEPFIQHVVQIDVCERVPPVVRRRTPFSSTPAFSHLSIILRTMPSVTRWSRNRRRCAWSMVSKDYSTDYPPPRSSSRRLSQSGNHRSVAPSL